MSSNNPWEKFGIKWGSPSSYNLWSANPALWALKYLHRVPDAPGPKAWLGQAVEAALEAQDRTVGAKIFDDKAGEFRGDPADLAEIRKLIEPMYSQANAGILSIGKTGAVYQEKVEHWIDGIAIPTIGYIDFLFEDLLVDLKTTSAMPSKPKPEHARQVAFYAKATGKPAALLYVTPKKWAVYELSAAEIDNAYRELRRAALALQSSLASARDGVEFFERVFTTFDDFRWNPATIRAAKELVMEL